MEKLNTIDNIIELESKVVESINLLEVAKGFCEFNYDKSADILALNSVIKIVLDNQNEIGECMEEIEKTLTKIKDEYKNSSQHVLHFLIAEQLLDYNNHPIRGVINNSYYFYYEIKKKLSLNLK